jgi:hypothetical protein
MLLKNKTSAMIPYLGNIVPLTTFSERDGIGYLKFDYYNGAMSTDLCKELTAVFK